MSSEVMAQVLEELRRIRKLLWLAISMIGADKIEELEQKLLSSEPRRRMYEEFDGLQSLQEIAQKTGVSSEAVRQFATLGAKYGLVELHRRSNRIFPEKTLPK